MNCTVVDLETYFDRQFSLKRLSIPEYVHDPRFRVHGIAIRGPSGQAEFRTDMEAAVEELRTRFGNDLEKTTIVGHHLQFDLYVLNHLFGLRPRFFVDTMLLAYHVHVLDYAMLAKSVAYYMGPVALEGILRYLEFKLADDNAPMSAADQLLCQSVELFVEAYSFQLSPATIGDLLKKWPILQQIFGKAPRERMLADEFDRHTSMALEKLSETAVSVAEIEHPDHGAAEPSWAAA